MRGARKSISRNKNADKGSIGKTDCNEVAFVQTETSRYSTVSGGRETLLRGLLFRGMRDWHERKGCLRKQSAVIQASLCARLRDTTRPLPETGARANSDFHGGNAEAHPLRWELSEGLKRRPLGEFRAERDERRRLIGADRIDSTMISPSVLRKARRPNSGKRRLGRDGNRWSEGTCKTRGSKCPTDSYKSFIFTKIILRR